MRPLALGGTIGILGGGQLGRMLASAAARLGFDVQIFSPEADAPAARVSAHHWQAEYTDKAALAAFAQACQVITFEFENIPAASLAHLEACGALVRPGIRSLQVSQDRLVEKQFLRSCAIETAPFAAIDSLSELQAAHEALGRDTILKTRHEGYDGKGQVRLGAESDLANAYAQIQGAPAILEARMDFTLEISALMVRGADGQVLAYDPPVNYHADGILQKSIVPAPIDAAIAKQAQADGRKLTQALEHIGVLALEMFVLKDGRLIANEFAPRVHNSGHWTQEACATGQFEQHIRAIAGWPLGPVTRYFDAQMHNLIGAQGLEDAQASLGDGETILTLYGKRDAAPGRKMGHTVQLIPKAE